MYNLCVTSGQCIDLIIKLSDESSLWNSFEEHADRLLDASYLRFRKH